MNADSHLQPGDLRGISRAVIDAIVAITDVVEAMHVNIAQLPGMRRPPPGRGARGISGLVYGGVRRIAGGVGYALDAALARLLPPLDATPSSSAREAVLAALNGVLGDYLDTTANPLAIPMRLRIGGKPLELERGAIAATLPDLRSRLLLVVHGLCMNDLQWRRDDDDPVAVLAHEAGFTALHLHYNSGRHISTNGREFSRLIEVLVAQWPVPVTSISIVAHSMGGLVARSACRDAETAGLRWRSLLRDLVFIATPHHGAPLERGGNGIDVLLGASAYTAPLAGLGKLRSAGITDLRYGNLVDEDWHGRDRFAPHGDVRVPIGLPAGVRSFAIAGTTARDLGALGHRLLGDGLVPLDSALGRHAQRERSLDFPVSRQWIGTGMGHLELLARREVWQQIRDWIAATDASDPH